MTEYQQNWHYFSTTNGLPDGLRKTCESWYEEMISAQPMHHYDIEAVSGNIPKEYAYLLLS
jgi:hypothetical protein